MDFHLEDIFKNLRFVNTEGGIGGEIKLRCEDFIVEEVPLYQPDGTGNHCYCLIEKAGISTQQAAKVLAMKLNINSKQIGFAGLKDADAVARQWISIENVSADAVSSLQLKNIKILQTGLHNNKLKIGHLAANKFVIKVRNTKTDTRQAVQRTEEILEILKTKGVPNYFGIQRFGRTGFNHLLGKACVLNDAESFLDIFLGNSKAEIPGKIQKARKFYEHGQLQRALNNWPPSNPDERRALKTLIKTANKRKAFEAVSGYLKGFYANAFQSYIFNKAVSERIPIIDKVLKGDLTYRHSDGKCFEVENPEIENPRCASFEISATAPLIGHRMTQLKNEAGDFEENFLRVEGFDYSCEVFQNRLLTGSRRPVRFQPKDCKISAGKDNFGDFLEISFTLSPGCYATSLLREIIREE